MRELAFALEYEPGCNRVADTLADHPGARIRSLSLHVTSESLWRVDHATGTPVALDDIEDAFLTSDYYADCLATEDCGATQTTEVLDRTTTHLSSTLTGSARPTARPFHTLPATTSAMAYCSKLVTRADTTHGGSSTQARVMWPRSLTTSRQPSVTVPGWRYFGQRTPTHQRAARSMR